MTLFDFDSPRTARRRMDELERFLVYWFGPRRASYGERPSVLDRVPLPDPLRRLHAFAGRWPAPQGTHPWQHRLLYTQDCLIPTSRLKQRVEDGKLVFLDENQGVWSCATNMEGTDPPVWVARDLNEEAGYRGKWGFLSRSLSRVLATFCLQESLFCSRFRIGGDELGVPAEPLLRQATPILANGPYPYTSGYSFYLLDGCVLIGRMRELLLFGTNDAGGIEAEVTRARSRQRGKRTR